jgi:hypothetical protein
MFSKESKLDLSLPFLQPDCTSSASLLMVCEYNSNVLTTLRTKFETFPFLLIPSGISGLSALDMIMKHSFPELALSYSISENIYLSRVILSFLQYSWNEDPKG